MPTKYKAKVKSRDKSSQTTGYERITEWQFIISIDETNDNSVMIIGRWFPTAKAAKAMAKRTADLLNLELNWDREVNGKTGTIDNGKIAIKKFIDRFGNK